MDKLWPFFNEINLKEVHLTLSLYLATNGGIFIRFDPEWLNTPVNFRIYYNH